ncbi:DUF6419 family natural product biosynthesis protein [Pseudoalteromonas sp. S554]|jgi:hypothetical protein|uniref:DUF6419 family natural product biosynthesis protein n=1 Tax=Pseudoalteromonas sp. S554 TaxID=2066516 RepID=UPI00110CB8D6|nr:DUF6419 family natural product biosynthesis protein [Pseudoalteromonas sp. S554]TMS80256.1 hypothetical protein CWB65_15855 [Pseudoalteromonas sp. S554]
MFKIIIGCAVIFSFVCMLLAVAPFTPAILGSFFMLLFAGAIGYKGYLQSSLILLLINTLAVIGSPAINIGNNNTLLFLPVLFLISFGGAFLGVRKLTCKHGL